MPKNGTRADIQNITEIKKKTSKNCPPYGGRMTKNVHFWWKKRIAFKFYKRDTSFAFRFQPKWGFCLFKNETKFQPINSWNRLENDVLHIYAVKTFTRQEIAPVKMTNSEIRSLLKKWAKQNRRALNCPLLAIFTAWCEFAFPIRCELPCSLWCEGDKFRNVVNIKEMRHAKPPRP